MKKRRKRARFWTGLIFLLLIAFAVNLYPIMMHFRAQRNAEKNYQIIRGKSHAVLKRKNRDMAGWLRIPGTGIDYPVMLAPEENPDFYLHRDFQKHRSSSGALFFPPGSQAGDPVQIIYGHHMFSGAMFGRLEKYYIDEEAFQKHRTIYLYRFIDRKNSRMKKEKYRVFAACRADSSEKIYSMSRINRKYLRRVKRCSLFPCKYSPEYGDSLLILSTCSYHLRNRFGRIDHRGRFLVWAERQEEN